MSRIVASPLTLDEMVDIRRTILAMEAEIHNPGAARACQHNLLADIEDALYRLADVIERARAMDVTIDSAATYYEACDT